MRTQLAILILAAALTGCAPLKQPQLSRSNPADPRAVETAYNGPAPLLMSGTNYNMPPQLGEEQTPRHEHEHNPAAEQKPATDHQHQHETPKQ